MLSLNAAIGSKLISQMSMFQSKSNDISEMFKVLPAIPTKFTAYNIFSGKVAYNKIGQMITNGGLYPRLSEIIGESATGKSSLMVAINASAVDYIRSRFGPGYSELLYFDSEKNLEPYRFMDMANWNPNDFQTKCDYTRKDLTIVELADLIMKISERKTKFQKDYIIPSGLVDIDGREIMMLAPTYICVDSLIAVNVQDVEKIVEYDKIGEVKDLDSLGNNMENAQEAKAWTAFVKKFKPFLDKGNIGLQFVNHKTKEMQTSMYDVPTRYLPFLKPGEKLRGGKEMIYQAFNCLDISSGDKIDAKNPIYGPNIFGFITRARFVKNKGNTEGDMFPMVFDQNKGYVPLLCDFEYLYQNKYGISGSPMSMKLDVLPEVTFTRKTLMDAVLDFPQLARAIQFTAKFHMINKMHYGNTTPTSLQSFGSNIPLERRLSILWSFTNQYEREYFDDPYKNFFQLSQGNRQYFCVGNIDTRFNEYSLNNDDIKRVSKGYTLTTTVGVTPYDADYGNAKVINGHYQYIPPENI